MTAISRAVFVLLLTFGGVCALGQALDVKPALDETALARIDRDARAYFGLP